MMKKNRRFNARTFFLACFFIFLGPTVLAQHKAITNIAGNGESTYAGGGEDEPIDAFSTGFAIPGAVVEDSNGDFYFSSGSVASPGRIYKINADEQTIQFHYFADGLIAGLAIDANDNLYWGKSSGLAGTDTVINKLTPEKVISVFAGTGEGLWNGDDMDALATNIASPGGLTFDPAKENLYFTDFRHRVIRKVNLASNIMEVVVGAYSFEPVDDPIPSGSDPSTVTLSPGLGIAIDSQDRVYFTAGNNYIYVLETDGLVYPVAGTGVGGYNGDDQLALNAQINVGGAGGGLLLLDDETLMFTDTENHLIRIIELDLDLAVSQDTIRAFAGTGVDHMGGDDEGDLTGQNYKQIDSTNMNPLSIQQTSSGEIVFTDPSALTVRKIVDCTNPVINSIVSSSSSICKGDSIMFTVDGTKGDIDSWIWYEGACGIATDKVGSGDTIMIKAETETSYFVQGIGNCTNDYSCAEFEVTFDCKEFFNVITPNNDGINDFFEAPVLDNYPVNTARFYDRWGNIIEEIENYDNETVVWRGTNGTDDGVADVLDSGTYFFVLSDENGAEITSGWAQIINE